MTQTDQFEFSGVSGDKYSFHVYKKTDKIPPVTGIVILSKKLGFETKNINFQIPMVIQSTFDRVVEINTDYINNNIDLKAVDHICVLQETSHIQRDVITSDLVAHYDEGNMEALNNSVNFMDSSSVKKEKSKVNYCLLATGATTQEWLVALPIVA